MAEYLIQEETLQGIADKIRVLSGSEDTMTPAEMQSDLDAVAEKMDSALFLESEEILLSMPNRKVWNAIAYGNGKYVAVASHTDMAAYSTDGITWTISTLPSSGGWESIAYGNGKFITVDRDTSAAAYSFDGITWTAISGPWLFCTSIAYGNDKFVAVGGVRKLGYSDDGINWTLIDTTNDYGRGFVHYVDDRFIAIDGYGIVDYSYDGITWVAGTSSAPRELASAKSLVYSDGVLVSFSYADNMRYYSIDNGESWNVISGLIDLGYRSGFVHDGEKFIYCQGPAISISYDGINWTNTVTQTSIVNNSNTDVTEETVQATKLLDAEMTTQDDLITQITAALEGKMVPSFKAICFSITDTYYPAEEGMTWVEWCESSYNTRGFYIAGDEVHYSVNELLQYNGSDVLSDDTIVSGAAYTRRTGGSSTPK